MGNEEKVEQKFILTLVDTTGIQDYIFKSNTLRHIAGASGLVHRVTHDWLEKEVMSLGASNLESSGASKRFEKDALISEVIYQGGGNALILFRNIDNAKDFTKKLSLKVIKEAPGLELVIVHSELPIEIFQEANGGSVVVEIFKNLFQKAARKKEKRCWSSPLPGLGVTAACPYTQKPATCQLKEEWISKEIYQKEMKGNPFAWEYFNKKFGAALTTAEKSYQFVREFNQFSGEEKGSYMAVAHLDGTGMGKRLLKFVNAQREKSAREIFNALHNFSESINNAVQQAMDKAIASLCHKVDNKVLENASGFLPFRPIVCDGDDITFVCDGKVGLNIAVSIMKHLAGIDLADNKPIAARAGVAVVKSHFPFSQAYHLAEQLNKSARSYAIDLMRDQQLSAPPMTIDWHISTSGTLGNLESVRKQYERGDIKLLMRPVTVGFDNGWRKWEVLEQLVAQLTSTQWGRNNSKLRRMEDVFFAGSAGLQKYISLQVLPELPITPELEAYDGKDGFIGNKAVHYDALDVIDFYK